MSDEPFVYVPSFSYATTYLALIKDLLGDLALENLRGLCLLENLVLSERKEALKDELTQGEPHENVLPWEERTVKKTRELLVNIAVSRDCSKKHHQVMVESLIYTTKDSPQEST
jgi:hypothetical protein